MLSPSRVKWRRPHVPSMRGIASRGNFVNFGDMGLMALQPALITANQIEACRIAINRVVRKTGRYWLRVFPDIPKTKKPAETRMGKGKGAPDKYVCCIHAGKIMFEASSTDPKLSRKALTRAMHKLPIHCKIVEREVFSNV